MYIGKNQKRLDIYLKNLKEWLSTGLDIYTVDSSGIGIDNNHPLLKNFKFSQQIPEIKENPSLTEKNSILRALDNFDFSSYDLVFKVTGKYFSDDFLEMIKYIPSDIDMVFQYQTNTHGQNSEIVGISPTLIKSICLKIDENNTFEQVLKKMYKSDINIRRMKKLSIKYKIERRDGSILNFL